MDLATIIGIVLGTLLVLAAILLGESPIIFFNVSGILIVLGLFPDHEAALYLTSVVLGVFLAALTLLWLVFMQRGPTTQAASDEAEQPAD